MTQSVHAETHGFQTEVKQLLSLMAHSLYSNKEVFLRELISNASDAADKLRFKALSDASLFENDGQLRVRLVVDKENKTLTISDNGIGMTRDQVIEHLGTIAKSGTAEFFKNLSGDQGKDSQLIGQFGVGFYSAFIVADKVTVVSRAAGTAPEQGVQWESQGEGSFTVADVTKAGRGTDVILHLRSDEEEFLDDWRLRSVVSKYSDHISVPVEMYKEGTPDREEDGETIVGTPGSGSRSTAPLHCGPVTRKISRTRSIRSSTSTSPTTSKIRSCGVTTGWKGPRSTPACSTSRPVRRSISTTASRSTA